MPDVEAKKILIVSSDAGLKKGLDTELIKAGYLSMTVENLSTATTELARIQPNLVVVDMAVGGADAFLFLESIRSNRDHSLAQVPVIIGSQSGNLMEIDKALKLGIKDYFIKTSFDPVKVVEKIRKHVGGAAKTSANPSVAKVLIIEDDQFLRELATQKLTKDGLTVFAAMDGEQGYAMAEKELPDIILLDILLPGIDGFDVLKKIKESPTLKDKRVVMLSNFSQNSDIEKAKALGSDQFLVKANFTLDEIVGVVRGILTKEK